MAMESERSIEKLLRDLAAKRREQAGATLDLHPADRRRLQAEVARQFAAPPAAAHPWLRLPAWFSLKWGLGLALLAVLAVSLALLRPETEPAETSLAWNRPPAATSEPEVMDQPARKLARPAPAAREAATPPARSFAAGAVPAPPGPQPSADGVAPLPGSPTPGGLSTVAVQQNPAPGAVPSLASTASARPVPPPVAVKPEGIAAADRRREQAPVAESLAGSVARTEVPANSQPVPASTPETPPANAPAPSFAPVAVLPPAVAAAVHNEVAAAPADSAGPVAKALPGAGTDSVAGFRRPAASEGLTGDTRLARAAGGEKFGATGLAASTRVSFQTRAAAPGTALATFRFELSGGDLRVIDADGSIYRGSLKPAKRSATPASSPTMVPSSREQATPPATLQPAATPAAGQDFVFRVTGTNRAHQRVVFSGNLIGGTNALSAGTASVSGKVVVGKGREVRIEAAPQKP